MIDRILQHDFDILARHAIHCHSTGHLEDAEALYRAALRLRPNDATGWSNLGLVLHATGRLTQAEQAARTALSHAATLADAHNLLGMIHHDRVDLGAAEASFRTALRLSPAHVGALINLGLICQKHGDLAEAEACYRHALALGANPGQVGGNLGLLLLEQGRVAEAEAACRAALAAAPENQAAQVNLSFALLLTGRFEEGWRHYEARCTFEPLSSVDSPCWSGTESIVGRTILLRAEQGFGDTLQFCRYALLLADAGANVVLAVQRPLLRLLSSLGGGTQVVPGDIPPPPHDVHCRLMSLPLLCGTMPNTIPAQVPYLTAEPEAVARWRMRLHPLPGLRVGLVWAGGWRPDKPHAAAIDRRRSCSLMDMACLAAIRGCSFVSLQLGPAGAQAASVPRGMMLHDFTADLDDFAETAALVQALDLVISVDTAVAHLAGALGRPVWLLNRFDSCWRWFLGRDDSPWYPTMRLYRQTEPGDWAGVMARVAVDLEPDRLCPALDKP